MYAASFFKRVVNIPRSLCLVVGGITSGALYLGGEMTVNQNEDYCKKSKLMNHFSHKNVIIFSTVG